MGAGMVRYPRVLEMSGIDAAVYSGFAFGLGQERVAMLHLGLMISVDSTKAMSLLRTV